MNKVLVVYATKSGCTTGIAERVAEKLIALGKETDVFPAGSAPGPEGYDAVIVGSGVRAGQWHGSMRTWLSSNSEALKTLPLAAFSVCLTPVTSRDNLEAARAYAAPPLKAVGVTPVATEAFAGWFNPKKFSFPERMFMRALKAKEGDYRDMAAVDAWTEAALVDLSA